MRALPECYGCLLALIAQATELATSDERLRAEAAERARQILDSSFTDGAIPARIATRFHEVIKKVSGNPDPFLPLKRREMAFARGVAARRGILGRLMPLREAALAAVAGNALDFFREHDAVELVCQVTLAVDHLEEAFEGLGAPKTVVYLADNAGEQYFDAPLLGALAEAGHRVIYGLKGRPVQNDLSINDLDREALPAKVAVASTGGAAVGLDLASSSAAFRALVAEASLVVAKGMGHYETIGELSTKRVLLLAKAKCRPVAEGLGVARDSFVARLLEPTTG
jgi:uncharacterized protein with ATP-grasp and redox domains